MTQHKKRFTDENLLNTNEVMHDYEFYVRLIIENQTMDFESGKDASKPAA